MTSRSELERIARDWIALWCAPVDWARFDRLHADEFEDCSSAGRPADKRGFAEGLAAFAAAFPDLRAEALDLVIEEAAPAEAPSKIAVRWRAEGTNRARYLGVGPTHRRTVFTGIEIIEIREGRIVRRWGEWDAGGHLGGASP